MNAAPLLEVRDLKVSFPTARGMVRAVDGVSFRLQPEEALGIVGESGCGKTVTALSILRLFGPATRVRIEGEVLFEDRNLLKLSRKEMLQIRGVQIGMVFQDPLTALDPVMPVGEQIAESIRFHLHFDPKRARARTLELLDLVGIPDPRQRIDDLPHSFSGGMRQRLVIAMAIACGPKVLIADEATTALDVTVQAQILRLINDLRRELSMALIVITHDLGVIAATCENVQVMYAGKAAEYAGVAHILEGGSHPYTQGLMRLVPRLDQDRHHRLRPIDGTPLTVVDAWQGCRFAPRCEHAWERCRVDEPGLLPLGPDHASACWLVEEPSRRSADRRAANYQPGAVDHVS